MRISNWLLLNWGCLPFSNAKKYYTYTYTKILYNTFFILELSCSLTESLSTGTRNRGTEFADEEFLMKPTFGWWASHFCTNNGAHGFIFANVLVDLFDHWRVALFVGIFCIRFQNVFLACSEKNGWTWTIQLHVVHVNYDYHCKRGSSFNEN